MFTVHVICNLEWWSPLFGNPKLTFCELWFIRWWKFFSPPSWKILYRSNKKNERPFLWQEPHEKRFVKNIRHHSQCIKNELYSREVTLGLCNFIQNQWKNQSRILIFRCIMHICSSVHLCKFWIKNDKCKCTVQNSSANLEPNHLHLVRR